MLAGLHGAGDAVADGARDWRTPLVPTLVNGVLRHQAVVGGVDIAFVVAAETG